MKMKKRLLFFYGGLLFPLWMSGQDPSPVRFVNTGKMYVTGVAATSLYVPASIRMLGDKVDVIQNGRTELGGDFVNDVTSGNIFEDASTGWYYFRGDVAQWIKGSASKQTGYINFPNVETFNRASVSLDAMMGMNVNTLKLSEGKFVLKSKPDDSRPATSSQQAHLLVKNGVIYTRGAATPQQNGVVEVELFLGDSRDKKFFGWTSPYRRTYSDYMFYNYLTEPSPAGLFGDLRQTIIDAEYSLLPGHGYLIGQGVYGANVDREWPDDRWSEAKFEDRFTDTLTFNRYTFNDIQKKSIAVASYRPDSYTDEELNTGDITIPLNAAGYHYLGNPYTTPLDMSGFVRAEYSRNNPWGVTRGSSGQEDVYNMFWVISNGYASNVDDANMTFRINVSYLVCQDEGSTLSPYNDDLLIAPMQLFLVYANKATDFTIPKSERTHGDAPFLRSSRLALNNELLIEVTDLTTKGFDRACVLFRPDASAVAANRFDAQKMFNRSGGVNQIWLPSRGADLSVSVVPYETAALEVAWQPSAVPQECTMRAYRMESLTVPECVLLEDRQTGTLTDLSVNPDYTFQSDPTDRPDRFALHFKAPTGLDNQTEGVLSCYYNKTGREIVIRGAEASDAQSIVTVYDTQGRQIKQTFVENGIIPFDATAGVYIVKVTGKRGLNAKIINSNP